MKTKPLKSILLLIGFLLLLMVTFVAFARKAKQHIGSNSTAQRDVQTQFDLDNFHHIRIESAPGNEANLAISATVSQPYLEGYWTSQFAKFQVQNDTLKVQLNSKGEYATIELHTKAHIESLILTNTTIQIDSEILATNRDIYIEASQSAGNGRVHFGLNFQKESYQSMHFKLRNVNLTMINQLDMTTFNFMEFNTENTDIEINENVINIVSPLVLNCDSKTIFKAPAPILKNMQLTIRD